ncbi:hypothetical protein ABZT49_24290, partial [Methylobacterium sp. EM32]|uniref:hypothetical protein n=1 Tax=Methylobacterium sp. EM32 TaxID=3163481 RepID=UPI0033B56140
PIAATNSPARSGWCLAAKDAEGVTNDDPVPAFGDASTIVIQLFSDVLYFYVKDRKIINLADEAMAYH